MSGVLAALRGDGLAYAAIALIALGGAVALVIFAISPSGARATYVAGLDTHIRFLLLKTTGERILRIQAAVGSVLTIVAYVFDDLFLLILMPLVVFGPMAVLGRKAEKRIATLELQLDGWLMVLSNALKAAPSLGEALATSAGLSRPPISEEVDLVLKEVRFGSPIDEALLHMASRVNSRTLWGAVATLLVGRQTGGDVSRILEESADALREMSRLEGVVKAKTADGKAQAYVLAGMPFVLLAAIHMIDPHWLAALGSSTTGYAVVGGAVVLWLMGFLSAKKILAVDL